MRITIDKAGRLVVPHEIRTRLQIRPGDVLDVEAGEESITLRPVREAATLRWENGFLIADVKLPPGETDIQKWIEHDREERDKKLLGL